MLDAKSRTRTKAKPPRPGARWRNLYWIWEPVTVRNGLHYDPGENFGAYIWPTCEIAEEKAAQTVRAWDGKVEYLCSVEVE